MAKQYYIDENGNPILVSGTVNTAELLPISGNDPTDTKTYIDTVSTGTLTTSNTNINILRSKLIKMPNGVKYIQACLQATALVGTGETILDIPNGFNTTDSATNFDLCSVSTLGTGIPLYIYGGNQIRNNVSLASGTVFIINAWYI